MNYDTSEYRASNYAVAANAISAYQSGATGRGVKIGVVDSGINPNLAEFAGRIDPASGDAAGTRGTSDDDGHGTAVTAVAAAARNGSNTLGVAFDATIISQRADTPGSCDSEGGCSFGDQAIATGIEAARAAGAKVINLSMGGSSPSPMLLSAMQRAVSSGTVLVISAGNDGEKPEGANPDAFALGPARSFAGMVIIAGSVGVDGANGVDASQISTFSNRAGTGAQYYLTAVGYRDRAPDQNGQQYFWSGTSFSAPTISGAVALLAQAFPNLSGSDIVNILFSSADDLGSPGLDLTYGRGRLNIARAMQPLGATTLGDSAIAVSTTSNGDLPTAAGDAVTGRAMGAIILDGYDRAFTMNLAATLRQALADAPLSRALSAGLKAAGSAAGPVDVAMTVRERPDLALGFAVERLGVGPDDARRAKLIAGSAVAKIDNKTAAAFGFAQGAKAMERRLNGTAEGAFLIARDIGSDPGFLADRGGSLALRRNLGPVGVTISGESGSVWSEVRTSAYGSPYRWTALAVDRKFGKTWLSAGLSRLEERDTLLGGRMGAALGGGGSTSLFVDAEVRRTLGSGWTAGVTARRGSTEFASGRFQTGAYGFDLAKRSLVMGGDRFAMRVAQPLRVESGGFSTWLPTGYDYVTGTATKSLTTLTLTPSGREIDGEVSYGAPLLGDRSWFGGNLYYRRQPGHIATAGDDVGAAIRLTLGF